MGWADREQRILDAVAEIEEQQQRCAERIDTLVESTGLDRRVVVLGVRALVEAAYLSAVDASTFGDDEYLEIGLLERGRRATGQWPPEDSAKALLDLIDARLADASEDERSRWERLRDAAKGLSAKALQELTIAFLKQQAGLG